MERHLSSSLEWLTFDHLSACPGLRHGFFLRHGGVSSGPFDSLNCGISQGDAHKNVATNRERALQAVGAAVYSSLYQKHTDTVCEADPTVKLVGDALITDQADLALMILHADCQAAIFYDPVTHALANVHAGWRGSVQNIYRETIVAMGGRFGSRPENLLVGISPSLGPDAAEFRHYREELPESFWAYQVRPTYFDFWEISRQQLMAAGVLPHHIEVAGMCTYAHERDFFSYRREKRSGRHATLAYLC